MLNIMKLRNIFLSILAGSALLASCTKEQATYLDNVKVSASYVAIPMGSAADVAKKATMTATITVEATEAWEIQDWKTYKDEAKTQVKTGGWLSVSPLKGEAGVVTVTFSAEASESSRQLNVDLVCGEKTQKLIVMQGAPTVEPATCAEVIAGPDSKNYRVTGTCTGIYNTTYGNWYLNDGTGEITIYGTLDKDGKTKNFESLGLEVGDKVTVEGPKTTYGTTVELVDVTVIEIVKSLLKLHNADDLKVGKDGGEVVAKFEVKGDDLTFDIEDENISVKRIYDIPAVKNEKGKVTTPALKGVVLAVAANDGKPRTLSLSFTSKTSSNSSTIAVEISQEGGMMDIADIKVDSPASVGGQVVAICNRGFILDDGTAAVLYYRSSGFAPADWKVGDVVEIKCSKVTAFNGAYQLDNGNVTEITKVSEGTYTYPTPEEFDQAKVDSYVALTTNDFAKYIKFTATLTISGNYYNYFITDGQTNGFSLYQGTNDQKALFTSGETYTVEGYLVSRSSGKYANFVPVKVE